MSYLKTVLCMIALSATLTACSTTSGTKVDQSKLSEFKKGKTTYSQVVGVLGTPDSVSTNSEGAKTIRYMYINSGMDANSYIPVVGSLIGKNKTETSSTYLTFDKNDVLQSYASDQGGTAFGAGAGVD